MFFNAIVISTDIDDNRNRVYSSSDIKRILASAIYATDRIYFVSREENDWINTLHGFGVCCIRPNDDLKVIFNDDPSFVLFLINCNITIGYMEWNYIYNKVNELGADIVSLEIEGTMLGNDSFIIAVSSKLIRDCMGKTLISEFMDFIKQTKKKKTLTVELLHVYESKFNYKNMFSIMDNSDKFITRSICSYWIRRGVNFKDIETVIIDPSVKLEPGVVIGPMVILENNTQICAGTYVGAFSWIENSNIGANCHIWSSTIKDCRLGEEVNVGPYAYLRGNCNIGKKASIGAHSEMNDTIFGEGSKCKHFSYLGHAYIEPKVNIGAGTITCNYDGKEKHKTIIKKEAFIGCDTMIVAPICIGEKSKTGAGSIIIEDIPDNSLAVGVPAKVIKKL
ncbi:hypothetical protein [Lutispora sp.]|uniref:hypothetical protein n=1 Tax=Lutispora sp. TaxID=2828727 RepID=UPI003564D708